MSDLTARVHSVDALKLFRVALIKFGEEASNALTGAEAQMNRMVVWLERDQATHWQVQHKKRTEALSRAQEALRMKKLFPDASGRIPTPVEEEKVVRRCKAALEEAEQKLAYIKRYSRQIQKEIMNYRAGVQRFATWVHAEIPMAVGRIDRMIDALEQYLSLSAGGPSLREISVAAFAGGMARPTDEQEPVSLGADSQEPAEAGEASGEAPPAQVVEEADEPQVPAAEGTGHN